MSARCRVLGIMNMSSRDAASCSAPSLASFHASDMNISWTMGQWDKVIIRDTTFFLDLNTLGLVIWNLESTKEGKVCAKFGPLSIIFSTDKPPICKTLNVIKSAKVRCHLIMCKRSVNTDLINIQILFTVKCRRIDSSATQTAGLHKQHVSSGAPQL